ncbi:MAG TPA: hypothetical protein DHV62_08555 [Elusimicrobia bacterium]|jgi:sugar-specific transcriptional regulator TrmB|nr:hypothetical protein [Elusimicrobiota bacterium]
MFIEKLKLFYLRWKYRNAPPEIILQKTLENADKTIDALENAWLHRPDDLPLEAQKQLQDTIEQAKELRRQIQESFRKNKS